MGSWQFMDIGFKFASIYFTYTTLLCTHFWVSTSAALLLALSFHRASHYKAPSFVGCKVCTKTLRLTANGDLTAADTSLQSLIPMLGSSMRMLLLLPTVILVVAEGIIRGVHLANSTLSAFRCAPLILLLAQAGKELTHLVSITRFECYSASLSQETTNNLSCQAGCESQFHSIFYHTRDQGAFLKFLQ